MATLSAWHRDAPSPTPCSPFRHLGTLSDLPTATSSETISAMLGRWTWASGLRQGGIGSQTLAPRTLEASPSLEDRRHPRDGPGATYSTAGRRQGRWGYTKPHLAVTRVLVHAF